MARIFLSHSSKDKEKYLRPLINKLTKNTGKERIVYDEQTFEAGLQNEALISDWLRQSDLFVLFLSNSSLESPWVKKEILEAKTLQESGEINKIYPIIIDPSITHEDSRIPEWMKEKYNLRLVSRPAVAARKIISVMQAISWDKTPKLKEKQQFFVGRNDLMQLLEVRLDDYTKHLPNTLIATGLEYIGRRTFLKKGLTKLNITPDTYSFPTIKLDSHQSIEDLIKLLDDFGITKTDISNNNLIKMTQTEKINLAVKLLSEINSSKDIILIIDEGAIISPRRKISSWFLKLNEELAKHDNGIFLCVVSKYRTNLLTIHGNDNIFSLHVPELSFIERKGLFKRYSSLIGLNLDTNDMDYISSFFSGLPEEIIYTCDVIKENGLQYIKKNINFITDYSDRKISSIMHKFDKDEHAKSLLALISLFDFVSYKLLLDIIGENETYNLLLSAFFAEGICDNIGSNGEYLVLNSAIKNYVLRQQIPINPEFDKKIKHHVKNFIISYDVNDEGRDVSDVFFSLKEGLINGNLSNLESQMLIPSHYLKSMKELYDKRNRDLEVVKLADLILQQEEFMDDHIIREIRYFLCSSLARLKKERFKSEVQYIDGAEHDFLFGFYYRQVGRDEDAATRLIQALESRKNFSRAKRELVTVYQNMDEFDKAYELSKENYEGNRNNEYHIQAYFQILLQTKKIPQEDKKAIFITLIKDIQKIESERAKNMYTIMYVQFSLYINSDINNAKSLIDHAVTESPDNLYIMLCQFDIYEKLNDIKKMKEILANLKSNIGNSRGKFYKELKKCNVIYEAKSGNFDNARSIIHSSIIPENSKQNLLARVDKIFFDKKSKI